MMQKSKRKRGKRLVKRILIFLLMLGIAAGLFFACGIGCYFAQCESLLVR